MARTSEHVRVILDGGGFYPHAFGWSGRVVRVLCVESLRTAGSERVFRVRTAEGSFELTEDVASRRWTVRRSPHWWERALALSADAARYEPARGRGRVSRAQAQARAARERERQQDQRHEGGDHAGRLVVVR